MACPVMFLSTHPTSDRLDPETVDAWHDAMVASEGRMYNEVLHGRAGPPVRMSVHPPSTTRHMPWEWLGEEGQEAEVLRAALED
jgi:hypothetical protein